MTVIKRNTVQQEEPVKKVDGEVLDAKSVDTGIELGKKLAESKGLGGWVSTALLLILLATNIFTASGGSNPNVELINERVTQEMVKPYTEQIIKLEATVNDLQLTVVELESSNEALVQTNLAYSATIISLQEQLKALE